MKIVDVTQVVKALVDVCGKDCVLNGKAWKYVSDLAGGDINRKCRDSIIDVFTCGAVSFLGSEKGFPGCIRTLIDKCGWNWRTAIETAESFSVALGLNMNSEDISWCVKAKEGGDSDVAMFLGDLYSGYKAYPGFQNNPATAMRWYALAITLKSQERDRAKLYIGECHLRGEGVAPDYAEAVRWFRLIEDCKDVGIAAAAQRLLGFCYNYGLGVKEDTRKAFMWYYKAAMNGNAEAQNELGNCYRFGIGVLVNMETAMLWYSRSSSNGCPEASANVAYCHGHGIGK